MENQWDAGETGCAQLAVGLRDQLQSLRCDALLEVIARSGGAPVDLPAWCRMTGHTLVSATHPVYVIRKNNP